MNESKTSKFWLDQAAEEIIERYPEGEIIVSSGHSPSGTYHIGTTREMMTASAIVWAIRQRGRQAKHVDFVDDLDVLRKIPADLPENMSQYLGMPLAYAPSPEEGVSYGEYFYRHLREAAERAGFAADETYFASETYATEHRYTDTITTVLNNLDDIRAIIERVSHRKLSSDWAPVQLISDNNRLNDWHYAGHNTTTQTVSYRTADGKEGELSYADGRVTLNWRVDWPARWAMWGVQVEPFGRDHATKGGSFDTGEEIVKVLGGEAPIPVPYEFIMTPGDTKKMSKSAGGVITPAEAMQVMPPEVLRYFIVRSRPGKQLFFDSGTGLYNLIDEFAAAGSDAAHSFRDAYNFATAGAAKQIISTVPFKHLVQVYQAARRDAEETLEILRRTGYVDHVKRERELILAELPFIENWLTHYAPDEVKFEVQERLHTPSLTDGQRSFLKVLATMLAEQADDLDGQRMHELIYAAKDQADITPQAAFQSLYRVILNKDYGPKAGWFLASLDTSWLLTRLQEAA